MNAHPVIGQPGLAPRLHRHSSPKPTSGPSPVQSSTFSRRYGAAAVIVYENRWILRLADGWRRSRARLIGDGGIPVDDLVAALDAAERS
ncbi:MAG: hypothetical protein ACRDN1_18240 [Trebonia sp.]